MDKDKFTLEEIEAAIESVYEKSSTGNLTTKKVITELTRPKHSFREGEVVINRERRCLMYWDDSIEDPCRQLTLSEMPKAVEDLRETVRLFLNDEVSYKTLEHSATAFDKATGGQL